MIVKILKESRQLKGQAGERVDCDAGVGNRLACLGYVTILSHDPVSGPLSIVERSGKEVEVDDV